MRMRCALGSRCSEREGKIEGGERSGCCLSSGTIEWTAWARDHVSLWLVSKPRDSIPAAGNRQHARPGPTERDRLAETGYFWGAGVTFFVSFPLIAVCFFFLSPPSSFAARVTRGLGGNDDVVLVFVLAYTVCCARFPQCVKSVWLGS